MKVAITGGNGFIGSALAKLLRQQGHEAVQLSRRSGHGVSDDLRQAFEGCDAVAHCAGINREIGKQTYQRVHIDGTRNVVEAAQAVGIKHISMVSFLRARAGTGWPYHESKWQAEEIIRNSGVNYTILKTGVVYGLGDHMLDHLSRALKTFPVFGLVGYTDNGVAPTHVDDMARILAAATHDQTLHGRTFYVIGPEAMPLQTAVRRVGTVVGKRPLYVRLPVWAQLCIGWMTERVMRVPLVALAQVRILSEGVVEPAEGAELLPEALKPTIRFDADTIAAGLPAAGRFGLRDLRCCCL